MIWYVLQKKFAFLQADLELATTSNAASLLINVRSSGVAGFLSE